MATTQNGWPIVGKDACDQGPFAGATFPNGILAGDVAAVAHWQLARYVADVEPVRAGTCWGWYVKVIEGTTASSNHGSATAWDINADQHPMGKAASANMSSKQIAACRKIIADARGVLRWGGDYTGRPDPMHWEIVGSRAQVAAFVESIDGGSVLVKKGDSGEEVKLWQNLLADLGYAVGDADGDYGPKMEAAVNAFRKDHGVGTYPAVTGWTGYAVLRELARKHAGRDGAPGKDGKDGAAGTLGGNLTVTGGSLSVTTK